MKVNFVMYDGEEIPFEVFENQKVLYYFIRFMNQRFNEEKYWVFLVEGQRVNGNDTISSLKIKENQYIDCLSVN